MTMNEYQKKALETAIFPGRGEYTGLMYLGLGLAGESGEVVDHLKKGWRDNHGEIPNDRLEAIMAELGDVQWYVAVMAADLGLTLEEIAQHNNEKLRSRQQRGVLCGEGDDR